MADHDQTKLLEAGEGRQVGVVEGSVGHVEVFLMASVRTSIIGRPRRLSRHRRAQPTARSYPLICVEPLGRFNESTALFNADWMEGAWQVPTWYEEAAEIIAVSQPPIPVDHDASTSDYWTGLAPLVRAGALCRLLPNHFGIHRRADGSVKVWADTLGLGRCYYVVTDDFVAASNYIGVLAHFVDGPLEADVEAIGHYVLAGWFMKDHSPIRGIRRPRESSVIEVCPGGEVAFGEHTDLTELVGEREARPDYDEVIDQTRTIARNFDYLSVRTPTVYLSGGRDSRMTASIWLSGGSSARVINLGTLETEAEIAQELMGIYAGQERGARRSSMTSPTRILRPSRCPCASASRTPSRCGTETPPRPKCARMCASRDGEPFSASVVCGRRDHARLLLSPTR
ncbi:hypothetical protein ACTXKH_19870 [Brachybacterium tyrofermentans]|uniref:hypothetical protein n=1 Tax=Brachybacterium tyrofermentans TaxID=47848 RepID=UPI003FD2141B